MGLFNAILGNASSMSVDQATREYGHILAKGEEIEIAYKLIRDVLLFTPKRFIIIDVQGVTGRKVEVLSIPYRSIVRFATETAGTIDLEGELRVWVSGQAEPIQKHFDKSVNIFEVQAVLAEAVASSGK